MATRISLVTPSYNQAQFLEMTIQSVIKQRESLHEYFVVDGGSSDNSPKLIDQYSDQIDWWVSEPDNGQSAAIHRGFCRATGDVLAWLNSDDVLLPGALNKVKAIFDLHPTIDIVSGYLVIIDAKDRIINLPRVPGSNTFLGSQGLFQISQQATFFRRSLYEKVGGLDDGLHCAMDFDLWARFYLANAQWYNINRYLAAFRKHPSAKGSGNEWFVKYQNEKSMVRKRYPELFKDRIYTSLLPWIYRGSQILSGRQFVSSWQTTKWRGLPLKDFQVESLNVDV